jgi:hypothetical protein
MVKKKLSGVEKFIRILIAASGIILIWRGIWGVADVLLLPDNYLLSSTVSIIIGIILLALTHTRIRDLF